MKVNIYLFILILSILHSCSGNRYTSDNIELKKNEFLGIVEYKEYKQLSRNSPTRPKELFLKTKNKEYFIKISEGYLSKNKIIQYIGASVLVKGEIKNGEWEERIPIDIKNPNPPEPRSGDYLIIKKIYTKKED